MQVELISEKVVFRVSKIVKRELTVYCKKNNITISEYVRKVVENSIPKKEKKAKK